MSLAAYRLPRTLRIGEVYAGLVPACRGVTAGSGNATTEIKIMMINIVDGGRKVYPHIEPTLFVDDLSAENASTSEVGIVQQIGGFTDHVIKRIHADGMEVSQTKSVISASSPKLTDALVQNLSRHKLGSELRVKSLGVGLAAGVARNTKVMKTRLKKFVQRLPRFKALRRAGVNTARIVRTGGVAALMHGFAGTGVSPTMLRAQRRATSAAAAPKSGLGGQ